MAQSEPAKRQMNSTKRKSRASLSGYSREQRPAATPSTSAPSSLSLATIQRAMANPHALAPDAILQLQRTAGNQAVQQLLHGRREASAQVAGRSAPTPPRRLQVGATHDTDEQEADYVARQVVSDAQPLPSAKRAQPQGLVQRQALGSFEAGGDFANGLKQTVGRGRALPAQTRAEFEGKFGADLGGVRIHTTPASNRLNRSIQAKAFTHGKDIHFRQGAYNPNSAQGKQLIAHELTHTIQQGGVQQDSVQQNSVQQNSLQQGAAQQSGGVQIQGKASGIQRSNDQKPDPDTDIKHLTVTSAQLLASQTSLGKFVGIFSSDEEFELLQKGLAAYEKKTTLAQKYSILKYLDFHATNWLKKNSAELARGSEKSTLILNLRTEVNDKVVQVHAKMLKRDAKRRAGKQVNYEKSYDKLYGDMPDDPNQAAVQQNDANQDNANQNNANQDDGPLVSSPILVANDIYAKHKTDLERIAADRNIEIREVAEGETVTSKIMVNRDWYEHHKLFMWSVDELIGILGVAMEYFPENKKPGVNYDEVDGGAEHQEYVKKVTADADSTSLKYLSSKGHAHTGTVSNLLDEKDEDERADKLKTLMNKHKLTRAEAMAIGIYTAPDYLYINPAVSGLDYLMERQLVESEIVKESGYHNAKTQQSLSRKKPNTKAHLPGAKQEGLLHYKMARSGLEKLPNEKTRTFRGVTYTAQRASELFAEGKVYTTPTLTSTSKSYNYAKSFAKAKAKEKAQVKEAAVLLIMDVKTGKDIMQLSSYGAREKEIMVLPGTEFNVKKVDLNPSGVSFVTLEER